LRESATHFIKVNVLPGFRAKASRITTGVIITIPAPSYCVEPELIKISRSDYIKFISTQRKMLVLCRKLSAVFVSGGLDRYGIFFLLL
jgi:hypothetical protein